MKKQKIWQIITGALVCLLIISILTSGFRFGGDDLSSDEASAKVISYIKSIPNIGNVVLDDITDEGNLYKLDMTISDQKVRSYVSKDGSLLFPTGIPLIGVTITNKEETLIEEIPKSDKPKVELFVMSFCPYGNKAEDTMLPVYNLLKDKVNWNIHYIVDINGDVVNSLHGQPEVDQDKREACALSESLNKWWTFATYVNKNCGKDGSCWEDAVKEANLDINKIKNCVSEKGLSLVKADEKISNAAGAKGSPTLIINGVKSTAVYQYGNSEAYKQSICSAFNKAPEECSKILTSTTTTTGGSC